MVSLEEVSALEVTGGLNGPPKPQYVMDTPVTMVVAAEAVDTAAATLDTDEDMVEVGDGVNRSEGVSHVEEGDKPTSDADNIVAKMQAVASAGRA